MQFRSGWNVLSCYITQVLRPPTAIASDTADSRTACPTPGRSVTARRLAPPCPLVQPAVVRPGRLLGCACRSPIAARGTDVIIRALRRRSYQPRNRFGAVRPRRDHDSVGRDVLLVELERACSRCLKKFTQASAIIGGEVSTVTTVSASPVGQSALISQVL